MELLQSNKITRFEYVYTYNVYRIHFYQYKKRIFIITYVLILIIHKYEVTF